MERFTLKNKVFYWHQWFHEEHVFHATKGSSLFTERFFEKQKLLFYGITVKSYFSLYFKILWMLKVLPLKKINHGFTTNKTKKTFF